MVLILIILRQITIFITIHLITKYLEVAKCMNVIINNYMRGRKIAINTKYLIFLYCE